MDEGKRRKAALVGLLAVAFVISLAVVGRVWQYSESQEPPKEENAEIFQGREDMTISSENPGDA